MRKILLLSLALAACSSTQVAKDQAVLAQVPASLAAACATASSAGAIAQATAPTNTKVAAINMYITAGCGTAEAVANLAAEPTSTSWLVAPGTGLADTVTVAAAAAK